MIGQMLSRAVVDSRIAYNMETWDKKTVLLRVVVVDIAATQLADLVR